MPEEPQSGKAAARPLRFARWRAASLILVHLLIIGHIIHWKIAGKTLAPLELHEVMVTAELGIVTAGFLFMTLAVLSATVFGRFFCSWACHLLALQDLCAWILAKLRIAPKPVRSRALLFIAPLVMVYMFVWPQVSRVLRGQPTPQLRVASPDEPWASFVTTDMWRNLPGPTIAILTLLLCGFGIVYLLGTRSFCRYVCPYGVVFSGADRLATFRIRVKNGVAKEDCLSCGICTGVCQTHIRVHEEVAEHGTVVSPNCLKDLDCVSVCPKGALQVSFGTPALLSSFSKRVRRVPYDLSFAEDGLVALSFLPFLFIFRGLYEEVPFLMSLGVATALAYLLILTIRLFRRSNVRLNNLQLRRSGALTTTGTAFATFTVILWVFVGHSAVIRWHEAAGMRTFDKIREQIANNGAADPELIARARRHLDVRLEYGLFRPTNLHRGLASICSMQRDDDDAEKHLSIVLERDQGDAEAALRLAGLLIRRGELDQAAIYLNRALATKPRYASEQEWYDHAHSEAHELLAGVCVLMGDNANGIANLEKSLALVGDRPGVLLQLGQLLIHERRFTEALRAIESALRLVPEYPDGIFYLGLAHEGLQQSEEALQAFLKVIRLQPHHARAHHRVGVLYEAKGYMTAAYSYLRRAVRFDPNLGDAHYDLARILEGLGLAAEAKEHYEIARRLRAAR